MSLQTRNPVRVIGANPVSGFPNTGEQFTTRGGTATATNYSGTAAGNDVLLYTGGGRLCNILVHTQIASGQPLFFYDSAVATSGGPFAASGHKIIGLVPTGWSGVVDRQIDPILRMDMPFFSGLVAATRSGTPGFTASFMVDLSGAYGVG